MRSSAETWNSMRLSIQNTSNAGQELTLGEETIDVVEKGMR